MHAFIALELVAHFDVYSKSNVEVHSYLYVKCTGYAWYNPWLISRAS